VIYTNENRDSFTVEADGELHKSILSARKEGRRYGGKLYSCTLAFELGAKILLGLEESEEDAIKQEIEELKTQKSALDQKERLRVEQLRILEASRTAKMSDASDKNTNVQKLAQRIIEVWDSVVIYRKYNIINSLVDIDVTRLNKAKIQAVFPKNYTVKPSIDEAIRIAINLLDGEGGYIGA
jgi:hypothetical protein